MFDIPTVESPAMSLGGTQAYTAPPQSSGVSLRKGEKISISKPNAPLESILVGLGWDASAQSAVPYDLDAEVFMLGDNGKVAGDAWFVFYGQPASPDGAVTHQGDSRDGAGAGDDETIRIKLPQISPQVTKLVFVVTINEARTRGHNFGAVKNAYIRIVNSAANAEIARFNLTDYYANVYSMVVGELYLRNGEWKFNPVGDGTADDLAELCARYGVNIRD
ncbi:tellurium resistance protein TerD [Clostridia bacterium]|nr:tellurium resistance protein TerD [Clostridia bacterium]